MAQPTFIDLYGIGANYNPATDKLEISKAALEAAGITNAATATPLEMLGAIVKISHAWLVANLDETVNATSRLDFSAPFFRNDIEKSSFVYNIQLFGDFEKPIFNPNDL